MYLCINAHKYIYIDINTFIDINTCIYISSKPCNN